MKKYTHERILLKLTSGVDRVVLRLGDRRSSTGFGVTSFGDRSTETLEFCRGEAESASDFATPLPDLLTPGVAGDALLL